MSYKIRFNKEEYKIKSEFLDDAIKINLTNSQAGGQWGNAFNWESWSQQFFLRRVCQSNEEIHEQLEESYFQKMESCPDKVTLLKQSEDIMVLTITSKFLNKVQNEKVILKRINEDQAIIDKIMDSDAQNSSLILFKFIQNVKRDSENKQRMMGQIINDQKKEILKLKKNEKQINEKIEKLTLKLEGKIKDREKKPKQLTGKKQNKQLDQFNESSIKYKDNRNQHGQNIVNEPKKKAKKFHHKEALKKGPRKKSKKQRKIYSDFTSEDDDKDEEEQVTGGLQDLYQQQNFFGDYIPVPKKKKRKRKNLYQQKLKSKKVQGGDSRSDGSIEVNKQGSMMKIESDEQMGVDFQQVKKDVQKNLKEELQQQKPPSYEEVLKKQVKQQKVKKGLFSFMN